MRAFTNAYQKRSLCLSVCFMLLSTQLVWAESEILTIEGARIRGNQELPNVLYVVPWQPPQVYKLNEPEQSLALKREIKTLERASFKRLLSYHRSFQQQAEKSATVSLSKD